MVESPEALRKNHLGALEQLTHARTQDDFTRVQTYARVKHIEQAGQARFVLYLWAYIPTSDSTDMGP